MHVFAFDRDSTVDVNPPAGRDPVPLEWVRYLAHETEHEVWAHGSYKLTGEADIPGNPEIMSRFRERWGDPVDHIEKREAADLQYWVDDPAGKPDPDLIDALADWEATEELPARHQRVRMLGSLFPAAETYVVVDNLYLGFLRNWEFYHSWDFVEYVEQQGGIEQL